MFLTEAFDTLFHGTKLGRVRAPRVSTVNSSLCEGSQQILEN